jgi:ribosome recycling factor
MEKAIEAMKHDFQAIRTGKASPALVESLSIDYYGATVRLKDIASITAPEPRLLVIQPWDQNAVKEIEKAIMASDIGISPVSDGRVIRLPVPELSEERRKDMVRLVHKRAEEGRVEVRSVRRDANDACKKAEKASEITEDDLKVMLDDIQTLTNEYVEEINKAMEAKENELMEV